MISVLIILLLFSNILDFKNKPDYPLDEKHDSVQKFISLCTLYGYNKINNFWRFFWFILKVFIL